MQVSDLFRVRNPEIRALHLTWIAFFITFYVWFNMAPLASSMLASVDWLTKDDIRLFAIANVALTIPARIIVGMALDRFGPRRVFSVLMVTMAVPTMFFAFGDSKMQLFVARLVLSSVGASFVVGIHMTALWFKPRHIGFAEGFYAGWGNFGSAAAAMTIPTVALVIFGGDDGWRYAVATSGVIMALYGVFYWFAITDGPTADTHKKPRKAMALEVSTYKDLALLVIFTVPLIGVLSILVYRVQAMGYIDGFVAAIAYASIAVIVIYQIWQVLRVNLPILRKGVPEDDRYPFKSVAALNTTYFANFGAELAVVSMLPFFFQETWGLTAVAAGLIASSFAFINLVARPMGGLVSDRMGNRRFVMLAYMLGIAVGFPSSISVGFLNLRCVSTSIPEPCAAMVCRSRTSRAQSVQRASTCQRERSMVAMKACSFGSTKSAERVRRSPGSWCAPRPAAGSCGWARSPRSPKVMRM
jgi:MFS transporter, NNP family, nitrate/nitrite transporter